MHELEHLFGLMVRSMSVNILMIRKTVKVFTIGMKINGMMELGIIVSNMVMEFYAIMVKKRMLSIDTEKE